MLCLQRDWATGILFLVLYASVLLLVALSVGYQALRASRSCVCVIVAIGVQDEPAFSVLFSGARFSVVTIVVHSGGGRMATGKDSLLEALQGVARLALSTPSVSVPTAASSPPILPPIVNPAELLCPKSRYGHELTPSRCGSSQDCSKRRCSLCGWNRPFLLIKCGCLTHYCRYSIIPIDSSHHLFRYTPCLECGKKRPECEQYWPYRAQLTTVRFP